MVVVHAFKPSTWEAEAGGSLWVQGLQSEFQDGQDCYTEKPCFRRERQRQGEE